MNRLLELDGRLTSLSELHRTLETGISNTEVLAMAQSGQGPAIPTIRNERLIDNVRLARSVFLPNAYYGTRLAANQQVLVDIDTLGAKDIDLFVTDDAGIPKNRLSDDSTAQRTLQARQQGKKVIAIFGGSTIMGTGSRLPAFTIPSLVEQILSVKYQIDTVCINRGILGMTSQDSFNMLTAEILRSPPDCVVFYTGWNCAFNQSAIHALLETGLPAHRNHIYPGMSTRHIEHGVLLRRQFNMGQAWQRAIWLTVNKTLTQLAGIFASTGSRKILDTFLKYDPTVNHDFMTEVIETITSGNIEALAAQSAQDYLRIHRMADACCKTEKVGFFNFFQPCLSWGSKPMTTVEQHYVSNSPPMGGVQRKFYEQICAHHKPDFFHDLAGVFDAENKQVFIDTGHLNPYGNFMVAEKIADTLAPTLH